MGIRHRINRCGGGRTTNGLLQNDARHFPAAHRAPSTGEKRCQQTGGKKESFRSTGRSGVILHLQSRNSSMLGWSTGTVVDDMVRPRRGFANVPSPAPLSLNRQSPNQ